MTTLPPWYDVTGVNIRVLVVIAAPVGIVIPLVPVALGTKMSEGNLGKLKGTEVVFEQPLCVLLCSFYVSV